jgi:hypothetical protein
VPWWRKIAERHDDLAAVALEQALLAVRDDDLRHLRRQEPLERAEPLDLADLGRDAGFERAAPVLEARRLLRVQAWPKRRRLRRAPSVGERSTRAEDASGRGRHTGQQIAATLNHLHAKVPLSSSGAARNAGLTRSTLQLALELVKEAPVSAVGEDRVRARLDHADSWRRSA